MFCSFRCCCCSDIFAVSRIFLNIYLYTCFFFFLSVIDVILLSSSSIWVAKVAVYDKSGGNTAGNANDSIEFVKMTGKMHMHAYDIILHSILLGQLKERTSWKQDIRTSRSIYWNPQQKKIVIINCVCEFRSIVYFRCEGQTGKKRNNTPCRLRTFNVASSILFLLVNMHAKKKRQHQEAEEESMM